MWLAVLRANFLGNIGVVVISVFLLWHFWPGEGIPSLNELARIIWQWLIGLAAALAFLVPFMKGRSGRAVLGPVFKELGVTERVEGRARGLLSQLVYLIRTIPARLVWVIIVIIASRYDSYLALAAGMWGIGYLVLTDAVDQGLILTGKNYQQRKRILKLHSIELLCAGAVSGTCLAVLAMTIFGWLIWTPGCFCGAARRVVEWEESRSGQ